MCLTACSNIFCNMFRTTQNGSKLIQRVKKAKNAPIFSKHAEEILTLFDLTHLCTNFVLVLFENIDPLGGDELTCVTIRTHIFLTAPFRPILDQFQDIFFGTKNFLGTKNFFRTKNFLRTNKHKICAKVRKIKQSQNFFSMF